ncbi:OmpA family protein [Alphaproteobacteria bacterium]|nr:OmpA family protein [Alphaproteobacteria bacterium]
MNDKAQSLKMIGIALTAVLVAISVGLTSLTVSAQETRVIGGHGGPSVEVDLSVLDDLPRLSTLPELLRPGLLPQTTRVPGRLPFRREGRQTNRLSARTLGPAPRPVTKPTLAPTKRAALAKTTLQVPVKPKIQRSASVLRAQRNPVKTERSAGSATTKVQRPPKAPVIGVAATTLPALKPVRVVTKTSAPATTSSSPPNPGSVVQGDGVRLLFDDRQSTFADRMAAPLRDLVKDLQKDEKRRVQLLAYATSQEGNTSKARRLSLSRALAVREYLMAQGIVSTRMDVRALGDRSKSGPANRVDVMIQVPR